MFLHVVQAGDHRFSHRHLAIFHVSNGALGIHAKLSVLVLLGDNIHQRPGFRQGAGLCNRAFLLRASLDTGRHFSFTIHHHLMVFIRVNDDVHSLFGGHFCTLLFKLFGAVEF